MQSSRLAASMVAALAALALLTPLTSSAAAFTDIAGNTHAANIAAIADAGVTAGCNADGTQYCPADIVTRAQMATFLARALDIDVVNGPIQSTRFTDVSGTHAANIDAIASVGITLGCNSDGTLFCSDDQVNRAQMASFIARAFEYPPASGFGFTDVTGTHTDNVSAIAAAGVTLGCNPAGTLYCPDDAVRRDQMGSFLARAMDIDPEPFAISVSRATVDFGWRIFGDGATEPETVTIQNTGLNSVTINSVAVSGQDATDFTIVAGAGGGSLTPGQTRSVDVVYEALSLTPSGRSATLSVATTEAGSVEIGLSGSIGEAPPEGFDLDLDRFYLSQSVPALDSGQSAGDRVDAVEGRDGFARAFVAASESHEGAPVVRMHWQTSTDSGFVDLAGPDTVPTEPAEATLGDTFTADVEGDLITGDLEIYVIVDPGDVFDESDESNNRYPASGWLDANAVTVPKLEITLVPITFKGVTPDLSDPEVYVEDTLRMLPVADYDVEVRSPAYVVDGDTFNWSTELSNVAGLRTSDGSTRMYHGIVDPDYSSGVAGIGYIGFPAAISWNRSSAAGVVAHELGHNFGLDHAPCGTAGNPDFPYEDASIGSWGYDLVAAKLKNPTTYVDFMSYCDPVWISDYYYQEVIDFRVSVGYSVVEATAGETTVVVGGTIKGGRVSLDPFYQLDVAAATPVPGPYTLVGRDAAGAVLFEEAFSVSEADIWQDVEDVASGFHFGFTIDEPTLAAVESVEVVHNGTTLLSRTAATTPPAAAMVAGTDGWTWDTTTYRQVLILDAATGKVIGVDRSGSIKADRTVDVVLSDGIHSETVRLNH